MRPVAIISKPQKEELATLLPELVIWMREHDFEPILDHVSGTYTQDARIVPRHELPAQHPALEVVLGGDGTLLAAARGDDASVRQLTAAAQDRLGGVDILVNCAARPAGQAPPLSLPEITGDAFWSDVNVKVLGYLRCAQAVAPGMIAAGWGRIISVSGLAALSTGSVIGSIRNVAVSAMTKNLADELGPFGVNVNAVHPGLTRTEATPGVIAAQAAAAGVEPAEAVTPALVPPEPVVTVAPALTGRGRLPDLAPVGLDQRRVDRLRRRNARRYPLLTWPGGDTRPVRPEDL